MSKKYDPDKPLTDAEMSNGKWMYGIDELPKEVQQAVRNSMRGRPVKENPKENISIRLDTDILQEFRLYGRGWQTMINNVLHEWLDNRP